LIICPVSSSLRTPFSHHADLIGFCVGSVAYFFLNLTQITDTGSRLPEFPPKPSLLSPAPPPLLVLQDFPFFFFFFFSIFVGFFWVFGGGGFGGLWLGGGVLCLGGWCVVGGVGGGWGGFVFLVETALLLFPLPLMEFEMMSQFLYIFELLVPLELEDTSDRWIRLFFPLLVPCGYDLSGPTHDTLFPRLNCLRTFATLVSLSLFLRFKATFPANSTVHDFIVFFFH